MVHFEIMDLWKKSNLKIPKVYYLKCLNKYYAVVEDDSSIVIVASKNKSIYAVAKSNLEVLPIEGTDVKHYLVNNSRDLHVISCGESTISEKNQIFTLKNIIPLI